MFHIDMYIHIREILVHFYLSIYLLCQDLTFEENFILKQLHKCKWYLFYLNGNALFLTLDQVLKPSDRKQ